MSIRQALRNRRISKRASQAALRPARRRTIRAPIAGLNLREAPDQIASTEASTMINMVPDVQGLSLRPGSTLVKELTLGLQYRHLYKWAYGTRREIIVFTTAGGPQLWAPEEALNQTWSTPLQTSTPYFSTAMFDQLLLLVSSTDVLTYNGGGLTGWEPLATFGLTGSLPVGVAVFKSRTYFWQQDSLDFFYSDVGVAGGPETAPLKKFPLVDVAQHGGAIMSINSWTRDAGNGNDDFFVVTTNKGEVLVYQGSNPNDAADWGLVGSYLIAEPVHRNGFLELDGKIYVITTSDIEILPDRFIRSPERSRVSKIAPYIRAAANGPFRNSADWQLSFDPSSNWIIVNVPIGSRKTAQLVRAEKGWCEFRDLNALSFVHDNTALYFTSYEDFGQGAASNAFIWQLGGDDDFHDKTPQDINFDVAQGYAMLGSNTEKRVSAYRPLFYKDGGSVTINSQLSFDLSLTYGGTNTVTMTQDDDSPWGPPTDGETPWGPPTDGVSPWGQNVQTRGEWVLAEGSGQQVSIRVHGTSDLTLRWAHTDYETVAGGMY